MDINLADEFSSGNLFVLFFDRLRYEGESVAVAKMLDNVDGRICYVCISKPYDDMVRDFKENNIDISRFFFIDMLSSTYARPEPVENCFFMRSPYNTTELLAALEMAIKKEKCSIIVFDRISEMLKYCDKFIIIKLTNAMVSDNIKQTIKKLLLTAEFSEAEKTDCHDLVEDLGMLADKKIIVKER